MSIRSLLPFLQGLRPFGRAEWLLFFGALALHGLGIAWGLPPGTGPDFTHGWAPDEIAPLGPLTEIFQLVFGANEDRFVAYPLAQYLINGALYAPYMAWLLLTGQWAQPTGAYPFGFADPAAALGGLTLIARSASLLMSAGIVVATSRLARALFPQHEGIGGIAGLFALAIHPLAYFGSTATLDVPTLFWCALGLVLVARMLREAPSIEQIVALGIVAAFAAGTKDQSVAVFVGIGVTLLAALWRCNDRAFATRAILVLAGTGLGAYAVTSGFVLSPSRWFAHFDFLFGGNVSYPAIAGNGALAAATLDTWVASLSWPLLLVGVAGIVACSVRDRHALWILAPAVMLFAMIVIPTRYVTTRFLLPTDLLIVTFGAAAVVMSTRRLPAAATWILAALLAAWPLAWAVELGWQQQNDARMAVAPWFEAETSGPQRVAYFGPETKLPALPERLSLVRPVSFQGTNHLVDYEAAEIAEMAAAIRATNPDLILVIPDHSSSPRYPWGTTLPPALFAQLEDGSLGYQQAVQFLPPSWLPTGRPALDYRVVNPEVRVFERIGADDAAPVTDE